MSKNIPLHQDTYLKVLRLLEANPQMNQPSLTGRFLKRNLGVPRVAHRGSAFVASDARRRGQLCTFGNPPAIHL